MKRLLQKLKDGTIRQMLTELQWIANYGKKYSWAVAWYLCMGILATAMGLISSVLGKNIIDIVTGYRYGAIAWVILVYVLMQLGKILLSALTGYISERVQLRVNQEIRADVFHKIMNARWQEISRFHSGDLLARTSRDAATVASGVMGWIPTLVINLVQFIGAFGLILYHDYTLAFLALLSAPVVILGSGVLTKRMRRHSKKMHEIGAEMTSFHAESFQNIQIIKSFGVVDAYRKKLFQTQKKQRDVSLDYYKFSAITSSFLSLIGVIVSGLCFLWSVYRLWSGHITYGEMTMFLQLTGTLSGAFGALVSMVPTTVTAATAAGRVMEVMELPAEEYPQDPMLDQLIEKGAECAVALQVEDVDFSYIPESCVFRNARLEAEPGQIIALVGPSGGGKTTMLRLMLGIVTPQKGSVRIYSPDTHAITVSAATRKLLSYVPQDNTLFSGTVAENLRIMRPDATEEQLWEVLRLACAEDFVKKLPEGLHTQLAERGNGLSEGQVQRISIARALLSPAPILLLDEATSALDVKTERVILRNIVQTHKNRTCIVTTHRPSVLSVCDRVYRIAQETVTPMSAQEVETLLMDF